MQRPGRDVVPNMTDYEAERNRFRLLVPSRFNAALDAIEGRVASDPDGLAVLSLDGDGAVTARHTWRELDGQTRRMAHTFTALGLRKGDPVFVMLPRVPEWYVVILGAIRLGAVPAPATMQLSGRDVAYRIQQSEAVAAVTNGDGAVKVDAARDELPSLRCSICVGDPPSSHWRRLDALLERASTDPTPMDPTAADDPLLLYFTSGTVTYPKMVMHTQASYGMGHTITARYWQDLKPGDLHWTVSDTGWAKAAWGKLFGQWALGATVVQMDMGKPDPDLILDTLARHRITTFCAPPTLYRMLILGDLGAHDLSALRHCVAAGEPLNPEVIRVWREGTGLTVYDGYGQTETVNLVANYRCLPVKPGSMGKPTPGFDIQIVDDAGNRLPDGKAGHVAVRVQPDRPVGMFGGYYRDPAATAEVFRGDWYFTGDRASRDQDGYFWFEARADDIITSAAYRIGPFEVESALLEHPAVTEAGVVGRDDPLRTQIVTAFVILKPGVEPSERLKTELQDHVKQVTAPYKYPREIYFVEELPKTVSGKIRRSELRESLRAGHVHQAQ
jgi:acyl-coenzyme A synthetase/AMP-(fatty) acid ligase